MKVCDEESKKLWDEVKQTMDVEEVTLGKYRSFAVRHSMVGLFFMLARYKFPMKMMVNRKKLKILDLGCNDGFGDLLIYQNCDVDKLVGVDFDEEAISWANSNIANERMNFIQGNFLGTEVFTQPNGGGVADFVISLDVIEHIPLENEQLFLDTICNNLHSQGVAIIGTPNEKMYEYANPMNKLAHINNYSQKRLYETLAQRFHNVFIFGLNDEVLHTGFYPMTCYVMAMCCGKRK